MSRKQLGEALGRVERLREDRRAAAHNEIAEMIFRVIGGRDGVKKFRETLLELRANPECEKKIGEIDDMIAKADYVIEFGLPRASRLGDGR